VRSNSRQISKGVLNAGIALCRPHVSWLEVKAGVYQLDKPAGADEPVKDVAALANTQTGGLQEGHLVSETFSHDPADLR
jgi:hypothetical protein